MTAHSFQWSNRLKLLRWLTDAGPNIPTEVRNILIGELLPTPAPVIMGTTNGMIITVAALLLHYNPVYFLFVGLELTIGVARLRVAKIGLEARRKGMAAPIEAAVLLAIGWCAIQGMMAFAAMITNEPTLQILSATMIMGVIGPICARNYPAPRLAFLLVCLCDLPFVMGGALSGRPWLLILLPMTPPALFGWMQIVKNFHKLVNAMLKAELDSKDIARRDPLTGLHNRLGFDEALKKACSAGDGPFVLMCLDLNGFKGVNDTLGHHAGDALLKAVAQRLKACAPSGDLVFRIGGDEFVVIAPGVSASEAGWLADGFIEQVSSRPYTLDGIAEVRIGASLGYACSPDDGWVGEDLHRMADASLYAAKAAGEGTPRRINSILVSASA